MNRRPPAPRPASGFTLLELLVVLTLVGLILGLAAPRLSAGVPGVSARAAVRDVAALLQTARNRAVTEQRPVIVAVDGEGRSLALDDDRLRLDPEVELAVVGARSEAAELRFYPDGSTSGASLRLGRPGHRYRVELDWLTGRVRIETEAGHG